MNKPNWKDAPEWANYLAMDEDGEWYWFDEKPEPLCDRWTHTIDGKSQIASGWKASLEERPCKT